ncbi:hypothetical protein [Desulfosporosinus sp. SB140]|uniref:hypothetical protein n=1 Tax=Desulfosporosinus paludis TaxID=3115649 RepID=UPI00388FFE84
MTLAWYGLRWDEVKKDLEALNKPYTFQITHPRGRMETWGDYRVVRLRDFDDRVDVVIAHEKFSRVSASTP